ncbi:MAG TPA: hypothetical protein VIJ36_03790 [Thermoanaerobaculia bacterium]
MRRRLWTLATLLLLALAAVPRPAAAGERAAVKPVKAAPGGLAAFWEGLRHLPFLAPLRKLGPEIDPAGAPKPSSPPGGTSVPQGDLGPGIDPWG